MRTLRRITVLALLLCLLLAVCLPALADDEPAPETSPEETAGPAPETDPPPTSPPPTEPAPTSPPPTEPAPTNPPQPTQPTPTSPPTAPDEEEFPPVIPGPAPAVTLRDETDIEYRDEAGALQYAIPDDWTAADVINWFIVTYGLDEEHFAVDFRCPATGEAYAWNEDTYMLAASTYKLPLNMYYYEKEAEGVYSGSTAIGETTLANAHYLSIVWSDNDISLEMLHNVGSFRRYKLAMLPYAGMTEADVPQCYWMENYYSARFMCSVASYLYEHLEDFPQLHTYLLQAMQGRYLQKYARGIEVAHKYGTFEGNVHDVGIIFTEQPFLLAVFTHKQSKPIYAEELIGRIGLALTVYQTRRTELDKLAPPETEPVTEEPTTEPETEPPVETTTEVPETELPTEPPTEPITTEPPTEPTTEAPAEPAPEDPAPGSGGPAWYFFAVPVAVLLGAGAWFLLRRRR